MVKNQQVISHWKKSFHMTDPEFLCKKACGLGPKFHANFQNKGNINCHIGYFDIQYRKTSKDSNNFFGFYKPTTSQITKHLPVSQWVPVYPSAHPQIYELTASVHVAPFIQGVLAHSLTSITNILYLQTWKIMVYVKHGSY